MYELNWITANLATGHAPMSYEDLNSIRSQGISAIINLCGEFCDLHEIEQDSGFDVYYLPIVDELVPETNDLEKALDWLDEAIYLNKKVLVHCRMGHGRTGTFIAAYLVRRGFDFKEAQKLMKGRDARPVTYYQRSFVKRYSKQEGKLRTASARIDNRPRTDETDALLKEYADLLAQMDAVILGKALAPTLSPDPACCSKPFALHLVESVWLSQELNRLLPSHMRQQVIDRALAERHSLQLIATYPPEMHTNEKGVILPGKIYLCPLFAEGKCLALGSRPAHCRYWARILSEGQHVMLAKKTVTLSEKFYTILMEKNNTHMDILKFSMADTVSGKFIQLFFQQEGGKVVPEKIPVLEPPNLAAGAKNI